MITSILQGGMGNQLFQYAHGLAHAKKLGVGLRLDVSSFAKDPQRIYNLNLWSGVDEPLVTESRSTVNEHTFPYDEQKANSVKDGDVLHGYWQTEKHFAGIRKELLERLTPKRRLTDRAVRALEQIDRAGKSSTFLAVRRGDYLTAGSVCVTVDKSYYQRACELVAERLGQEPTIFVWSDEPDWCEANLDLGGLKFQILGTYEFTSKHWVAREDEDLWLMSRCFNAVMAASSFSWWGAWLSPREGAVGRTVVGPKKWFNESSGIDGRDVMPGRWFKI